MSPLVGRRVETSEIRACRLYLHVRAPGFPRHVAEQQSVDCVQEAPDDRHGASVVVVVLVAVVLVVEGAVVVDVVGAVVVDVAFVVEVVELVDVVDDVTVLAVVDVVDDVTVGAVVVVVVVGTVVVVDPPAAASRFVALKLPSPVTRS